MLPQALFQLRNFAEIETLQALVLQAFFRKDQRFSWEHLCPQLTLGLVDSRALQEIDRLTSGVHCLELHGLIDPMRVIRLNAHGNHPRLA